MAEAVWATMELYCLIGKASFVLSIDTQCMLLIQSQVNVTIPLARKHDDNATADDQQDGDGMVEIDLDIMLSGVEKVGNPQF